MRLVRPQILMDYKNHSQVSKAIISELNKHHHDIIVFQFGAHFIDCWMTNVFTLIQKWVGFWKTLTTVVNKQYANQTKNTRLMYMTFPISHWEGGKYKGGGGNCTNSSLLSLNENWSNMEKTQEKQMWMSVVLNLLAFSEIHRTEHSLGIANNIEVLDSFFVSHLRRESHISAKADCLHFPICGGMNSFLARWFQAQISEEQRLTTGKTKEIWLKKIVPASFLRNHSFLRKNETEWILDKIAMD